MISVTNANGLRADNDYEYLNCIRAYIASGDGSAAISFFRKPDSLIIHIVPSDPEFKQDVINNILAIHRLLGLKAIFSKSLSISKTVSYTVEL